MSNKDIRTCELIERVVVTPFHQELSAYLFEHSWKYIQGDREKGYQRGAGGISLRVASHIFAKGRSSYHLHSQFIRTEKTAAHFPLTLTFLRQFAKRKRGILSRAFFTTLLPGEQVHPHADEGEYYAIRDRYHIVLSSKGSEMLTGGVTSTFVTGDLFYFNNHLTHEAYNNSDEDRIHIIFDVLPIGVGTLMNAGISIIKSFILFIVSPIKRRIVNSSL